MIRRIVIILALVMTLASFPAKSFELLMFHDKNCGYCLVFDRDVGFDYNTLEVAKILPLTVIDFHNPPEWVFNAIAVGQIKEVTATPTFIVWDERVKKEVDRLSGYVDREWFIGAIEFWINNHTRFYDEDGNLKPDSPQLPESEVES